MSVQITTYERSTLVNSEKYIGLDVHQATIVVALCFFLSDRVVGTGDLTVTLKRATGH